MLALHQWYADEQYLRQQYVENQKSVKQIARELQCSHTTVLAYLRQFGILVRPAKTRHYQKGQTAYGKRVVRGMEVDNKVELATIEKIKDLRGQNFSYWKIADILNSMKIPTKNKGSRWHPTTVMKILKANGIDVTETPDSTNEKKEA